MAHVFIPNKKHSLNDGDRSVETAVSPYELSTNVDLDNPIEHTRDPKPKNLPQLNRNPARRSVEVKPKKWNPKGIHGKLRAIRFPELFNMSRYGLELIAEMKREFPEPSGCRAWIEDVLAPGVTEDMRGKFVVTKHPGFPQYWALFEIIRRPDMGPHYRLVSIAMQDNKAKGYLPEALQSPDHRWEHMRGEMGDPREFTRRDFEILREQADLRTLGAKGVAQKMEQREAQAYNEADKVENDYVLDFHEYMFDWLRSAANYGRRHKSYPTVTVGENSDKYAIEQKNGYRVKVERGSKAHERILAEAKLEAAEFEGKVTAAQRELDRQRLYNSARQLEGLPKGKRTL